uniref:Putative secreted protein n=1 Tax=Anopheles darlingi TaxID=43151 RepID=A0A2M4DGH2_ANODA
MMPPRLFWCIYNRAILACSVLSSSVTWNRGALSRSTGGRQPINGSTSTSIGSRHTGHWAWNGFASFCFHTGSLSRSSS